MYVERQHENIVILSGYESRAGGIHVNNVDEAVLMRRRSLSTVRLQFTLNCTARTDNVRRVFNVFVHPIAVFRSTIVLVSQVNRFTLSMKLFTLQFKRHKQNDDAIFCCKFVYVCRQTISRKLTVSNYYICFITLPKS